MHSFALRAVAAVAAAALALGAAVYARAGRGAFESRSSGDRVADARKRTEAPLRALFSARGAAYPPTALYIRAFKREQQLEMWSERATDDFVLVESFPICAQSGALGPKRTEGDGQVPEGLYDVTVFNAKSRFHLSLGIDYPNASDRALGKAPFGGDIMIHGGCVTIGCIPLGDDGIEHVFLAATDAHAAGHPVVVHIFPGRMADQAMPALERVAASDPQLLAFWRSLRPAFLRFEATHKLPRAHVDRATGLYVVDAP